MIHDKRLQFVATQDAPNRKINNGYKMLDYKEGDTVQVWGVLYSKMLIGYKIDSENTTNLTDNTIEWMVVETKNLDSSVLRYFPTGDRVYQIYGWSMFGSEIKSKNGEKVLESIDINKLGNYFL